jgi:ribosomal protein S18 acetylase RimI-like enzyme
MAASRPLARRSYQTLGGTMNIRRAREFEAVALSALAFDSKQHWGYSPQDIKRWLPGLIVSSHDIASKPTFIAEIENEVAGFYLLTPKPQAWELDHLWVVPKFMRCGIGRALLAHAANSARLAGVSSIVIDSDPNAEPFYVACGATRQGVVSAPSTDNPGRFRPQLKLQVKIRAA